MLVTNSNSLNGNNGAAAGVGWSDVQHQKVQNVSEHGSNGNTCFTAACNDTAAMILKNMDRSVEPCDNSYRYACGGYLNLTKTPDDKHLTSSYTSIFDKLHEQVRASVEADIEPNEPRAYRLVKKFYMSCMNEFLTAGILQGAFFSKDRPRYLNYGTLEFVSGHEMTHAFSVPGWQYNGEGLLTNWWQPNTEKEYLKRALCIVHQYINYTVQEVGLNVNGWSIRDENIADNGGMKAAYLAYSNGLAKNKEEQKLPAIDMTPNQLFWMSTANMWRTKYTKKVLARDINEGPHTERKIC